jgi:hypothetical protein
MKIEDVLGVGQFGYSRGTETCVAIVILRIIPE